MLVALLVLVPAFAFFSHSCTTAIIGVTKDMKIANKFKLTPQR